MPIIIDIIDGSAIYAREENVPDPEPIRTKFEQELLTNNINNVNQELKGMKDDSISKIITSLIATIDDLEKRVTKLE